MKEISDYISSKVHKNDFKDFVLQTKST